MLSTSMSDSSVEKNRSLITSTSPLSASEPRNNATELIETISGGCTTALPAASQNVMSDLEKLEEVMRLQKLLDDALDDCSSENSTDKLTFDAQRVLEVLEVLGNIQIDKVILSKSKIGLCVGNLRRHSNPKVRSKATFLVKKWKEIISYKKSMKSNAAPGSDYKMSSISVPTSLSENFIEPINLGKPPDLPFPGPFSGDSTRDKARGFLWKALVGGVNEAVATQASALDAGKVVGDIEIALWKEYVVKRQNNKDYNAQLKTLKWNFADNRNPDLNVKVLWGVYSPEQLAVMKSAELASDEKKKERELQKKESMEACQSDWEVKRLLASPAGSQGQFPCFKCRKNKTVYFQMQTRSSDEPMTTFVACLECGNRWKF